MQDDEHIYRKHAPVILKCDKCGDMRRGSTRRLTMLIGRGHAGCKYGGRWEKIASDSKINQEN